MRSEQLDISFEELGKEDLLITMAGNFYNAQIPNIWEKLESLIADGNRRYIIDVKRVVFRSEKVIDLFVRLLNDINGRGGRLILIYELRQHGDFFARASTDRCTKKRDSTFLSHHAKRDHHRNVRLSLWNGCHAVFLG